MSFHISFFARDINSAHNKLREAYAPASVKALIKLALGGIARSQSASLAAAAPPTQAPWSNQDAAKAQYDEAKAKATYREAKALDFAPAGYSPPRTQSLCGIKIEATGHIDENGLHSFIDTFRVDPLFD